MGYLSDAVRGVFWIGSYRGSTRIVSLVRTFVLVRILTPADFGLVGIATILLTFLEIFTETGVNAVLIQTKENISKYVNTAWMVSIARGFFISVSFYFLAPFAASFFNNADATRLIRFFSLIPLVRGFVNPSEVFFQKNLLFKKEFMFRTSLFLVDATVTVLTAYITKSPYSIAYGLLVGALVEVIASHLLINPKPALIFNKNDFFYVLSRGKWLTASGVGDFLFQNMDNIFVGKLLGTSMLGVYSSAYALSTLPVGEVSNVLSKVTFPIFVRMTDDKTRLYKAYLKTVLSVFLISLLPAIVLLLFPEQVVSIFFGPHATQWEVAIPVLRILGFLGVVRATVLTSYAILLANGKQESVTYVSLSAAFTMIVLLPLLIPMWGMSGAAVAALIGAFVGGVFAHYFVKKIK